MFGSGVSDVPYEWRIWEYKFSIGVYIGKPSPEENERIQECLQERIDEIARAMNVPIEEIKWEEPYGTTRGSKRLCIYYPHEVPIRDERKEREALAERMASEMKKLEKATKKILHRCR